MTVSDSTGTRRSPKRSHRSLDIAAEVAILQGMTVDQLRKRYTEVYGEACRTRHRTHLVRKIAWRMQALAEGDLSERARRRAEELANDADVRVAPPRNQRIEATTHTVATAPPVDSRLPAVGQALVRNYKGRQIRVIILPDGFDYNGHRYRSLSAVAKAITGSHCNGFRFFGREVPK